MRPDDVDPLLTAVHVAYLVTLTAVGSVLTVRAQREKLRAVSTLDTTLRILPRLHAPRSWRLVERNIASSRGAWLVFVSGFFEPLFYLFAMGVGVGALVGTVDVDGQAVGYREFVAPALLAASAMNGAVYESGNVFFKLKYARTYEGVLATPMTVRDVALGELTYTLIRGTVYSIGFVTVMLAHGPARLPVGRARDPGGAARLGRLRRTCGVRDNADALMGRFRVHRAVHAADVPLLGDVRPGGHLPGRRALDPPAHAALPRSRAAACVHARRRRAGSCS